MPNDKEVAMEWRAQDGSGALVAQHREHFVSFLTEQGGSLRKESIIVCDLEHHTAHRPASWPRKDYEADNLVGWQVYRQTFITCCLGHFLKFLDCRLDPRQATAPNQGIAWQTFKEVILPVH